MGDSSYSQVGSAGDVRTLNQHEQAQRRQGLQGVLGTAANYDNLIKALLGGMKGQETSVQNAAKSYDPNAATREFMALNPQMQQVASQSAQQALSPYGASASDLAQTATQDALRSASAQLAAGGMLNTGAAQASLMEAAIRPQQELQTQLAGMQAQYQGNILSQLLGQTGNQLQQGYSQQGAQNLQAALANQQGYLQGMGLAGNMYGQQGQLYGSLADLTQQQYWQPQYAKEPGFFDYFAAAMPVATAAAGKK